MSVLPAVVLLRSAGMTKESMALPDFLAVGFLVAVGFLTVDFCAGADLALAEGDFLLEVLASADLVPADFLAGLTSASLGEDLDLALVF